MEKSMARITNALEEIRSQNPRPISLDVKTKFRIIRSRLNAINIRGKFLFFMPESDIFLLHSQI